MKIGQTAVTNFYPRSPRGERHCRLLECSHRKTISIHAPRVGSDKLPDESGSVLAISIHAPRVGSDCIVVKIAETCLKFLSTLPAWGATVGSQTHVDFSFISIHAPRVGSDTDEVLSALEKAKFLSTLPAWGATRLPLVFQLCHCDFYPRSPRGERPEKCAAVFLFVQFLSTLPAWGATANIKHPIKLSLSFLSTLPAWGAT